MAAGDEQHPARPADDVVEGAHDVRAEALFERLAHQRVRDGDGQLLLVEGGRRGASQVRLEVRLAHREPQLAQRGVPDPTRIAHRSLRPRLIPGVFVPACNLVGSLTKVLASLHWAVPREPTYSRALTHWCAAEGARHRH